MNLLLHRLSLIAIDALWRRRFLVLLPFLIILPLGMIYLKFGPRPYVAKCLLLLQENVRDNPLVRDAPAFVNMNDRINGLQALLKSDRVLNAVIGDIAGDKAPTDPEAIARLKQNLSDALTLDLIGNDFLQLQMRDATPKDLGKKLEAVLSRFVEALLPAQDVPSAMQALVERRKEELDAAELEYARFHNEAGAGLIEASHRENALLADYNVRLERAVLRLDDLSKTIAALRKPRNPGDVEAAAGGRPAGQQEAGERNASASPLSDPAAELRTAEAQQTALKQEIRTLTASVEAQQRKVQELGRVEQQLRILAAEAAQARKTYQAYASRYRTPISAGSSPTILKAPERIKVIDLPRDPVFPVITARRILLITILLCLAAAITLVVLAELFDTTMRRSKQFEELTGAPVLSRLPGPHHDAARTI